MAATELKPVYLLTGTDRPKIGRALQRLRARVGEQAVEHVAAPPATGDDAVAACNTLGFFSGDARLVVVASVDKWKAADVVALGMRQDEGREPPHPEVAQLPLHSSLRRTLVDEQCSLRHLQQDGVALADVEEGDAEPAWRRTVGRRPQLPDENGG